MTCKRREAGSLTGPAAWHRREGANGSGAFGDDCSGKQRLGLALLRGAGTEGQAPTPPWRAALYPQDPVPRRVLVPSPVLTMVVSANGRECFASITGPTTGAREER